MQTHKNSQVRDQKYSEYRLRLQKETKKLSSTLEVKTIHSQLSNALSITILSFLDRIIM